MLAGLATADEKAGVAANKVPRTGVLPTGILT